MYVARVTADSDAGIKYSPNTRSHRDIALTDIGGEGGVREGR